MDAEGPGADPIDWAPMVIGPFLVDVPGDWDIVDYPDERVTVVREPIAPDDPVAAVPGFVVPNIALRFFELPSSKGGVARSATQEAAATYDQVPGAVLLAVSPFVSREGLPGRAHVMAGIQEGVPFLSSRWHLGDGDFVLELTLTGPATPIPDLMELGHHVAESVRSIAGVDGDIAPEVPLDLQDLDMMAVLREQSSAADPGPRGPGLESVAPILAARPLLRDVPQTVPLEPEAWASLLERAHGGARGRLMRSSVLAPAEGLVRAGLATKRRLTDIGSVWGDLGGLPPVLTIHGRRSEGERRGEIRIEGMDCFITLDPPFATDRELDPRHSGSRWVGALLSIGLPAVLLDWCGLRADWFADLQASGPVGDLNALCGGSGADSTAWVRESGGVVMDGILADPSTRWTVALADGPPQLSWIQPDHRGPMSVYGVDGGDRVRLESTTGLVLFEALSRLIRDVARSPASTVKP